MPTLYETQLAEAEAAYHKLMMGAAVVEVKDSNGEMIRYQAPNANKLASYIEQLKRKINGTGCGPMGVIF